MTSNYTEAFYLCDIGANSPSVLSPLLSSYNGIFYFILTTDDWMKSTRKHSHFQSSKGEHSCGLFGSAVETVYWHHSNTIYPVSESLVVLLL